MRRLTQLPVFITALLSSTLGLADPGLSLSKLAPAPKADGLPEGRALVSETVSRNDVRFWKFTSKAGVIYVPASDKFSPDKLADAVCMIDHKINPAIRELPVREGENPIDEQIAPHTAVIQATISNRCTEAAKQQKSAPDNAANALPYAPPGGNSNDSSVFSRRGMRPNLNVGKNF